MPLATAAADPADEPPGMYLAFQGLPTGPNSYRAPSYPCPKGACSFFQLYRPGLLQFKDANRIFSWYTVFETLKGCSRSDTGCIVEVFDPHRNAM